MNEASITIAEVQYLGEILCCFEVEGKHTLFLANTRKSWQAVLINGVLPGKIRAAQNLSPAANVIMFTDGICFIMVYLLS